MSENKTEEKKFLLKQRKALWWNVADKPGVKSEHSGLVSHSKQCFKVPEWQAASQVWREPEECFERDQDDSERKQ